MKKELKISWLLLYLLLLAFAMLLYVNLVLNPLLGANAQMDLQHSSDEEQISTFTAEVLNLPKLLQDSKSLDSQIAQFKQEPPPDAFTVTNDLSAGLKSAGVTAESLSTADPQPAANAVKTSAGLILTQQEITLSLNCNEAQLDQLLTYLEKKSPLHYYIEKVNYSQGDGTAAKASLNLSAYFYAPAPAGWKAESTGSPVSSTPSSP